MQNWKFNTYCAHGLYVKNRSHYMTGPITIYQYVSMKIEYIFEKIAKKP